MPEIQMMLAVWSAAFAVAGVICAVWYWRAVLPALRKVRSLEAQVSHMTQELTESRAVDLRPLIDALPDPMILVDATDRVALLNAPATRLLQLSGLSAVGRPFVSVVTDQSLLELFDAVRKAPREEQRPLAQKELKLIRSGTRFAFQAVAVRSATGSVLLLLRDVTQMAAIVQMKTDFVSNAGHELRTPIAAIKIAFETLREVLHEDPYQTDRCVGIIDGHIRRLEEMLRDLLDLSRVESPDLQAQVRPLRAAEIFSMVGPTLTPVAREKGLELTFSASNETSVPFNTDPRLLNLILKNLVENSIKFTPPGGRITVTLAPTTEGAVEEEEAEVEEEESGFSLSVTDTGMGIAPDHLDRVFERFYQVDPARTGSSTRGTGLGLAIVKHAVHTLGGTVEIASTLGLGTTITCVFPRAEVVVVEGEE